MLTIKVKRIFYDFWAAIHQHRIHQDTADFVFNTLPILVCFTVHAGKRFHAL
jgi:hypothetical protein